MIKPLTKALLLLFLLFQFAACSGDNETGVFIETAPSEPLAILAPSRIAIVTGVETTFIDLNPPWSPLRFNFSNESTEAVTIVAMSFTVTDPITGEQKTSTVVNFDLNDSVILSTIRAAGDVNCDGFVTDLDNNSEPVPAEECNLDQQDISQRDDLLYIEGLISGDGNNNDGSTLSELYRGSSFPVQARFEGWFGPPNQPVRNFYQEFFFTLRAN